MAEIARMKILVAVARLGDIERIWVAGDVSAVSERAFPFHTERWLSTQAHQLLQMRNCRSMWELFCARSVESRHEKAIGANHICGVAWTVMGVAGKGEDADRCAAIIPPRCGPSTPVYSD